MTVVDSVLNIARSQIGTTEFPAGSNNVLYNTAYYGQPVYDGLWGCTFPWCVTFLWWVFRAADAKEYFFGGGRCANCGTLADYYEEKGQLIKHGYKKGDIAFFAFNTDYQHVGIIEEVNTDGTYTTIEGNTSDIGSQDNGGAVCRKRRLLMNICAGARWYEEADEMTGEEIYKALNEYLSKLPCPEWAEKELEEAKKMGITDGSRPRMLCSRLEAAIMCKRAVEDK